MYCSSQVFLSVFRLYFFFKQKTAYEMRISDWSSDVCSSDLGTESIRAERDGQLHATRSVDIFIVGSFVRFTLTVLMTMFKRLLIQLGRASCRERVGQYLEISVEAVSLKKKKNGTTKVKEQE